MKTMKTRDKIIVGSLVIIGTYSLLFFSGVAGTIRKLFWKNDLVILDFGNNEATYRLVEAMFEDQNTTIAYLKVDSNKREKIKRIFKIDGEIGILKREGVGLKTANINTVTEDNIMIGISSLIMNHE